MAKLGILAGGGELPALMIQACRRRGWDFHVIALTGNADPSVIASAPHDWVRLGEYGKVWGLLREKGVDRVVLGGKVERPPVSELLIDWRTAWFLARIGGRLISDNRLLEAIVKEFESRGFAIIGPSDVAPELLAKSGAYGTIQPDESERAAIAAGFAAARSAGRRDVGQAAVVIDGKPAEIEGADGTDALIERCAVKGAGSGRTGLRPILVKARKPQQQMRSDPPVIGLRTLAKAAAAGFRGIAVETGGVLVLDGAALGKAADEAGMFLVGMDVPG